MTHITAIINAHREGLLAGPSINSFAEAVDQARSAGLIVQTLAILDRPDTLTQRMFADSQSMGMEVHVTDFGDPGMARNKAAEIARGTYVAYLDADDLWSFNWLGAAHELCEQHPHQAIAHSEMNVVFGDVQHIWMHRDSTAPDFDPSYLAVGNYWDAMVFTRRAIMLEHPYVANDLKAGYGHEDWNWNCTTWLAGIAHLPVPGTVHFKRRRNGSQMASCAESDVVPWPTAIYEAAAAYQKTGARDGN